MYKILMISYLVELDFEARFGLIHSLSFLCLYFRFLKDLYLPKYEGKFDLVYTDSADFCFLERTFQLGARIIIKGPPPHTI